MRRPLPCLVEVPSFGSCIGPQIIPLSTYVSCADVTNVAQARIAEEAGACAVMALERIPAEIRREYPYSR